MFKLFSTKCSICHRKAGPYRFFKSPEGKKLKLCYGCSEYAERRAYKKMS